MDNAGAALVQPQSGHAGETVDGHPVRDQPENGNGFNDGGLMQINSSRLPILRRHGIGEAKLGLCHMTSH
jgi:hypothetical protein